MSVVNEQILPPAGLLPRYKINAVKTFSEPMTIICCEVKRVEAPTKSLNNCQSHTYLLVNLLFRFARILDYKKQEFLMICSLIEPCAVNLPDQIRGKLCSGHIFWLIFPKSKIPWLRFVIKDLVMITNGFLSPDTSLRSDLNFDSVESNAPSDDEDVDGDGDDDNNGRNSNKQKNKALARVKHAFQNFDVERGCGVSDMKKVSLNARGKGALPDIYDLRDVDRGIELYFCLSGILRPLYGTDTALAWRNRLHLLSPEALFSSKRRARFREQLTTYANTVLSANITSNLRDIEQYLESVEGSSDPSAEIFVRHAKQICSSTIISEGDRLIDFTSMTAYELEKHMVQPEYFLKHRFPDELHTSENRGVVRELSGDDSSEIAQMDRLGSLYHKGYGSSRDADSSLYDIKNPGIAEMRIIWERMGYSCEKYLDYRNANMFLSVYDEFHKAGILHMSKPIASSYEESEHLFNNSSNFHHKCLNAKFSTTTGHRIPFVTQFANNLPIGYQTLFGFLQLIYKISGTSNLLVELLFILLSALNQVKPHCSMSLHCVLISKQGTGKSRCVRLARSIIGEAYSIFTTYRTPKTSLTVGDDPYGSSKKMLFMSEYVSPTENSLQLETSADSCLFKAELDEGCLQAQRCVKQADSNTGKSSFTRESVVSICDNAFVLCVNEKNFCNALDSRFTTFNVAASEQTVLPGRFDDFKSSLDKYGITEFFAAVRHLILETARLNELDFYPHIQKVQRSYYEPSERALLVTYDKLSHVCHETGILFGLKDNIRFRTRLFDLTRVLSEVFAIFKVYGEPPGEIIAEAEAQFKGSDPNDFLDFVVQKHIRHLKSNDRVTLHTEVVAESQSDPADLLFCFSLLTQFLQSEINVVRFLANKMIDAQKVRKLNDGIWYFQIRAHNGEAVETTLARELHLPVSTINQILIKLRDESIYGYSVLKDISPAAIFTGKSKNSKKEYYILARHAAQIYLSTNAEVFHKISDKIIKQLRDVLAVNNCVRVGLQERETHAVSFMQYLPISGDHDTSAGENGRSRSYYVSEIAKKSSSSDYPFEATINFNFFESRMRLLRIMLISQIVRNKFEQITEDGFVPIAKAGSIFCRNVESLCTRNTKGKVISNSQDNMDYQERVTLVQWLENNTYRVHVSIYHAESDHLSGVRHVRKVCIDEGKFCEDFIIVKLFQNPGDELQLASVPNPLSDLMNMPCVSVRSRKLYVNIMLLAFNTHQTLALGGQSVMKTVIERTIFKNMTERSEIVYIDRVSAGHDSMDKQNPFSIFRVLNLAELEQNLGGLPEYFCQNPYKCVETNSATIDACVGEKRDIRSDESRRLTVCKDHVSKCKSEIRMYAYGIENEIRQSLDNCEDDEEYKILYEERFSEELQRMMQKQKDFYAPIKTTMEMGTFPTVMMTNLKKRKHAPTLHGNTSQTKQRVIDDVRNIPSPP